MMLYESNDSFLEETVGFEDAKYVVIQAPLDLTTTYLKGTKFGPRSVVESSRSLENYDVELDYEIRDKVFTLNELELPPDINKSMDVIKLTVSDVLANGKFPIILGGEHTCGYGASMAFPDDTVFVIFDAHADFKKNVLGVEINHASNSRLIHKTKNVALIGVRSLSLSDKNELKQADVNVVYSNDMIDYFALNAGKPVKSTASTRMRDSKLGVSDKLDKLTDTLRKKKVYISIDMDVFDPALAPGVGTPQPGGITYQQFFSIAKRISEVSDIVGLDVVEIRPIDDNKITEVLAAKIVMDIIALKELKK